MIKKDVKELVLARLETLNPDSKILLMGEPKPVSVHDMIEAVNEESDFGRKIAEVQIEQIKMMARGEI